MSAWFRHGFFFGSDVAKSKHSSLCVVGVGSRGKKRVVLFCLLSLSIAYARVDQTLAEATRSSQVVSGKCSKLSDAAGKKS